MADPQRADDLFAWGDAAWWLGRVDDSIQANQAAYQSYLAGERPRAAALAAMNVAVCLLLRGEEALGSGWLSRAQRLLAGDPDCVESGMLRYFVEVEAVLDRAGTLPDPEAEELLATARQVRDLGQRHGEPGLVGCGLVAEGRVLIKRGRVGAGLALLDEAMVAVVSSGEAPELAGNVYCHLMAAAHELADLRRARDWTEATGRWLAELPAAALFHRHLPGAPLAGAPGRRGLGASRAGGGPGRRGPGRNPAGRRWPRPATRWPAPAGTRPRWRSLAGGDLATAREAGEELSGLCSRSSGAESGRPASPEAGPGGLLTVDYNAGHRWAGALLGSVVGRPAALTLPTTSRW